MLISEIVVEATGDKKFDRMLKDIVTPSKPSIFKRIRGFLTPDVDKTTREAYDKLATYWGSTAASYWEFYKGLTKDDPRYKDARTQWEDAMGHRVLYDMLSGREEYNERLAQMIQQRHKIDPRKELPSI
jgi:hypothetical protein